MPHSRIVPTLVRLVLVVALLVGAFPSTSAASPNRQGDRPTAQGPQQGRGNSRRPPPDFVPAPLRPRPARPATRPIPPPPPRVINARKKPVAARRPPGLASIQGAPLASTPTVNVTNAYLKTLSSAGGRFIIGTTGGDPATASDDNKRLLYGYPDNVGSSATTLRVSTGSATADYRLGDTDWDDVGVAPLSGPTSAGNTITTVWELDGVRVEERAILAVDPASGIANTVAIDYTLKNTQTANRIVGLRVLLDTQIGGNDGAPFLVPGAGQVTTERAWNDDEVPPYWIAYESATFDPASLRGYGWLSGSDASTPDRFIVAAWGWAFDTDWDYTPNAGRSITGDSAALLYYNPVTLAPGEVTRYRTYYGASIGGVLPDDQNRVLECPCPSPQTMEGGPFNSRTGSLWTAATDLSVLTPGPDLTWSRTYVSQASDETSGALGAGWQHAYAAQLFTASMPQGEAGRVVILSPQGNRFRFSDQGGGQFAAFPGVNGTLTLAGSTYTLTWRDQRQWLFDVTTGQLTAMRDTQGRQLNLEYSGSPARLTRIVDALTGSRALTLTYNVNGQIETVSDGTRTVSYTYLNGDLRVATDVMGRPTTYTYQNHLLTGIDNALGQAIERTIYDAYTPAGRVISQTLQAGQQLSVQYLDASTVITTTGRDGRQEVKEIRYFDPRATMTGIVLNGTVIQESSYDSQFSPSQMVDGNGNVTGVVSNAQGQPLAIQDALGQQTAIAYDAQSRPITITDSLGRQTTYSYDSANNSALSLR